MGYVKKTPLLILALLALLALAAAPALAAPKPRLAKSVVVKPAGGKVIVKKRGGGSFRLRKATSIPTGSIVDTTRGTVKLTSARSRTRTQSGVFKYGKFKVTQQRNGLTDLALTGGSFTPCEQAKRLGKPVAAAQNRRRRLFGRAHGRFRTRGRNSSATIRGTTWSIEDRCNGTVTENMSPDPNSKIQTTAEDELEFELEPGQTITYYCNKYEIAVDTYCVLLLAEPDKGYLGGGILTQVDVPSYYFCVRAPDGQEGCTNALPLSERDPDGWRQAIFVCPVRQIGTFYVGWSLDGETLLEPRNPPLSLTLNVEGPDEHCFSDPETAEPIAKALANR